MPAALIPIVFNPAFWAAVGEAALWTAAAVGVGYAGSKVVESVTAANEDANEKAKPVPIPDAATCATGNCPPPECKDLNDKSKARRGKIKQRYQELREDKRNLFKNHYYKWQAHPIYGSWEGHVEQLRGWQRGLRNILDEARSKGCPSAGDDVNKAATEDPPSQPGPKP